MQIISNQFLCDYLYKVHSSSHSHHHHRLRSLSYSTILSTQAFSSHQFLFSSLFHFYTKMRSGDSTTIDVPESSAVAKGKAPLVAIVKQEQEKGGWKRGVAIFDFLLRLGAIITALAAASTMGTSDETLPFFTQFFQFQASYDDLPTFQYVIFHLSLFQWFNPFHA